jgi:hypothetical protein
LQDCSHELAADDPFSRKTDRRPFGFTDQQDPALVERVENPKATAAGMDKIHPPGSQ